MTTWQPGLLGDDVLIPSDAKPAIQLDLIDAAAERRALESGRPRSQERAEILGGDDQ